MNSFTNSILSCFDKEIACIFRKYKYRKYEFVLSAHVRGKQMHSKTWKKRLVVIVYISDLNIYAILEKVAHSCLENCFSHVHIFYYLRMFHS